MAGSTHGQDEQILSCDWLHVPAQSRRCNLTRFGFPITRAPLFTVNLYNKSFIGQACSAKMVASRILSSFFFCVFMYQAKGKKELGQYPAILISSLANNQYYFINETINTLDIFIPGSPLCSWTSIRSVTSLALQA